MGIGQAAPAEGQGIVALEARQNPHLGVFSLSFGDMMRVPGGRGSFLDAKAQGADIRMVYSPLGAGAAIIGPIKNDPPDLVLLKTQFGGTRIVDMLVGDPLPRIC